MKIRVVRNALGQVAAALALGALAQGQISFSPAHTYPCGDAPQDVVAWDFDGDGDLDVAATVLNPPRVSTLLNNGDGTFGAPIYSDLPQAQHPIGIAAPDLDRDGLNDLVVASFDTDELFILHNLGGGHFAVIAQMPAGDGPYDLACGDLDADMDCDIVVSNQICGKVRVVRNEGFGQFTALAPVYVGLGPRCVQLGHFVHPSTPGQPLDVAVAVHDSHEIHVLYNKGGGKLVPYTVLAIPGQSNPEGLVSGDFNGDGKDDVAACFTGTSDHKVAIFHQQQGGFAAPYCYNVGMVHPTHMVGVDFDRDTRLDLAFVSPTSSRVTVLRQIESGQYGMQGMFDLAGPDSDHLAVGDFDGNFMPDLIGTNDGSASLSLLLNTREQVSNYCYAAINSTGVGARIGATGTPSVLKSDFALTVSDAPPSMNGLFIYSATPTIRTFAHGYLCLTMPIGRLRPVDKVQTDGTVSHPLDFQAPPLAGGPLAISAGSVWNFQFWYRDYVAGGRYYTNLTDGLRVVFTP